LKKKVNVEKMNEDEKKQLEDEEEEDKMSPVLNMINCELMPFNKLSEDFKKPEIDPETERSKKSGLNYASVKPLVMDTVPIHALVDTGCSHTAMSEKLWLKLKKKHPEVAKSVKQRTVDNMHAKGAMQNSAGQVTLKADIPLYMKTKEGDIIKII